MSLTASHNFPSNKTISPSRYPSLMSNAPLNLLLTPLAFGEPTTSHLSSGLFANTSPNAPLTAEAKGGGGAIICLRPRDAVGANAELLFV